MIATGVTVATLSASFPTETSRYWMPIWGLASLFGVLGFTDDVVSIPISIRFGLQLALSIVAVLVLLDIGEHHLRGFVVSSVVAIGAIWLTGLVNMFNFMDGIDGIAGMTATIAGLSDFLVSEIGGFKGGGYGLMIAAAAFAFLPYNLPMARVFLGDAGSYFLGASLGLLAAAEELERIPIEAIIGPLAIVLADTLSTLGRRIVRGEPWLQAHRSHVYQQLVRLGLPHGQVTKIVALLTTSCSALGAASLLPIAGVRWAADGLGISLLWIYLELPVWFGMRRCPRKL